MIHIRHIIGDATRPQGDGNKIIVHCCNDVGAWGAGFVTALSARWAKPEREYRAWASLSRDGKLALGEVLFVEVEPCIIVANLVGQQGVGFDHGIPPIRYHAIGTGLLKIAEHAIRRNASVHMPRLGCGLAGGEWHIIEQLVEGALCTQDIAVTVYDLPA
jgi:O-acetyl-ADP-ribose deacetylase (regulator of RNase III)